jgi:hypothetical protein
MPSREILNSHPISTLKKEISKTNIKGYSKMKKSEVVNLMLKNKERFGHIKMNEKTKKSVANPTPKVAEKPKKKEIKFVVKKKDEPKPQEEPKKKKNINFIVKKKEEPKPKPVSELKRVAGVTKEEANKMKPAELFGKLPVELRKMVLDPKETGVVVGRERVTYNQFMSEAKDIYDEKSILEDLKEPNIPDSFVKKVQDLSGEVTSFRYSLRRLFFDALGIKSSSKNDRQLYELLKRNKKWTKIIPHIGKSARDIWRENTGELMLKINKLKNERKKY